MYILENLETLVNLMSAKFNKRRTGHNSHPNIIDSTLTFCQTYSYLHIKRCIGLWNLHVWWILLGSSLLNTYFVWHMFISTKEEFKRNQEFSLILSHPSTRNHAQGVMKCTILVDHSLLNINIYLVSLIYAQPAQQQRRGFLKICMTYMAAESLNKNPCYGSLSLCL